MTRLGRGPRAGAPRRARAAWAAAASRAAAVLCAAACRDGGVARPPADAGRADAPGAGRPDARGRDASRPDLGPDAPRPRPDAGPDAPPPPDLGADAYLCADGAAGALPVVNEIDYDMPATDDAEFVELFHPGCEPFDLSRAALVLVRFRAGAGVEVYRRVPLAKAGALPPGGFLLVGNHPDADPRLEGFNVLDNAGSGGNFEPAAVVLVRDRPAGDAGPGGEERLDVVTYEGGIVFDWSEPGAVPGDAADAATPDSLQRIPNGRDTDVNRDDFRLAPPTPGRANRAPP